MPNFCIVLNIIIFVLLAALHFYWAFGVTAGKDVVIPTYGNGRYLFIPSVEITVTVALGMLFFALVNLAYRDWFFMEIDHIYTRYGTLIIAVIFLLRGIGDFSYIGLSKRHKESPFAKMDTRYYSPLCLFIAAIQLTAFLAD